MSTSTRTPHPVGADAHIGPHTAPPYTVPVCTINFAPMRRFMAAGTAGPMWASAPTNMDQLRCFVRAGTSSDTVRHKAAVHHPVRGGDGGLRLRRGLRHLRMALWDAAGGSPAAAGGDFAPCAARVFRWLRPADISPAAAGDQRLCLWKPRFGQRAAGWQEVSARNFVSEQGPASPPYWMYGKKLGRSYGAKGPATPEDTPAVSCPTEKNRVKLLSLFLLMGFAAAPESAAYTAKTPETN